MDLIEVPLIKKAGLFLEKTLMTEGHRALVKLMKDKREAAGLTQAEIAKAIGEHQSFVARLESGQRRIDVVEYIVLSKVIGFDAIQELQKLLPEISR